MIKIAQFGLGPIGLEALKHLATQPWAQVVGGIDIDPAKRGHDLGYLTGAPALHGVPVFASLDDLLAHVRPDAVLQTTVSNFRDAFLQIRPFVERGIDVVSSCEQLIFPSLREPELAMELDQLCRKHDARVVAAGVNPGFVMDLLPLCLTGVCREVRAIFVERVVDASSRRGPLQRKIGSGLPGSEFKRLLEEGKAGHAGLQESLALLAHGLGWKIDHVSELAEPVIADQDIVTEHVSVRKGQTCGTHQRAEAHVDGRVALTLDLRMYLGAKNPHDAVRIDGRPPLHVTFSGGVAGDDATVAALVNTAARVKLARPGLLLITDLPLPRMAPG